MGRSLACCSTSWFVHSSGRDSEAHRSERRGLLPCKDLEPAYRRTHRTGARAVGAASGWDGGESLGSVAMSFRSTFPGDGGCS